MRPIPVPRAEVRRQTLTSSLLCEPDASWRAVERELALRGLPLHLLARSEFAASRTRTKTWLLVLGDESGRTCGAVGVHVRPVREFPGHYVLEAERFGSSIIPEALPNAARALAGLMRDDPRALRMDLDVFSRDDRVRVAAGTALEAAGFHRAQSNNYVRTLIVDLTPSEEAIFASIRSSARRNVRQLEKHPFVLRPIDDVAYIPRIEQLMTETLGRTGGVYVPQDWRGRIALSNAHPSLSRLVGVFRNDCDGPDALVSFMWGAMHGDHGQYRDGASTRLDKRVPLAYALLWDLIKWSKQQGATWFDLGGVTDGHQGDSDDPLAGISDFKRHFTSQVERIGDSWEMNATTLRARAARAIVQARAAVRRWR